MIYGCVQRAGVVRPRFLPADRHVRSGGTYRSVACHAPATGGRGRRANRFHRAARRPRSIHMDSLSLSVLTPHSYANGCRCRECMGLAEFMLQATGKDYGLPGTEGPPDPQKPPLRAVPDCTGSLTCDCPDCTAERLRAIKRQKSPVRQPWDIKAA